MRLSLAPLFHPQRPTRQWLAASLCAWSVAACAPGKAPSVVLVAAVLDRPVCLETSEAVIDEELAARLPALGYIR